MRVVLVRLSALGDIVHTWPLAVALRQAQPEMHLTWVVEEPFRPLVEGHPAVDALITVATKRWRRNIFSAETRSHIAVLKTQLTELQPDVAIDSQGVFKSALVTGLSGASTRIGLPRPWRRERLAGVAYTSTVQGNPDQRHVVATNLQCVAAVGEDPPSTLPHPDGRWMLEMSKDRTPVVPMRPQYLALLPGTGRPEKIVPEADLVAVAQWSVAQGLPVTLLWGPGEKDRASSIVNAAGEGVSLAPPTDLFDLAHCLANARAVVGGDTGPIHLAASFGTPTLAVFTATDWRRNGPLGARTQVVSGALLDDGGPTGSSKAFKPGPVTTEQIIDGLKRVLGT
jgi:heptosyltransferase-1